MKLRVGKIPYTMKCEIDGCTANAEYAFDAESGRPAGRLHLCRECWSELVRLDKAQRFRENIAKSKK